MYFISDLLSYSGHAINVSTSLLQVESSPEFQLVEAFLCVPNKFVWKNLLHVSLLILAVKFYSQTFFNR